MLLGKSSHKDTECAFMGNLRVVMIPYVRPSVREEFLYCRVNLPGSAARCFVEVLVVVILSPVINQLPGPLAYLRSVIGIECISERFNDPIVCRAPRRVERLLSAVPFRYTSQVQGTIKSDKDLLRRLTLNRG